MPLRQHPSRDDNEPHLPDAIVAGITAELHMLHRPSFLSDLISWLFFFFESPRARERQTNCVTMGLTMGFPSDMLPVSSKKEGLTEVMSPKPLFYFFPRNLEFFLNEKRDE